MSSNMPCQKVSHSKGAAWTRVLATLRCGNDRPKGQAERPIMLTNHYTRDDLTEHDALSCLCGWASCLVHIHLSCSYQAFPQMGIKHSMQCCYTWYLHLLGAATLTIARSAYNCPRADYACLCSPDLPVGSQSVTAAKLATLLTKCICPLCSANALNILMLAMNLLQPRNIVFSTD